MKKKDEKKEIEKIETKKPAHEVIVQKIIKCYDDMEEARNAPSNRVSSYLKSIYEIAITQRIQVLLEVLKEIIIPDGRFKEVVDTIKIEDKPDSIKQSIQGPIEKLKRI